MQRTWSENMGTFYSYEIEFCKQNGNCSGATESLTATSITKSSLTACGAYVAKVAARTEAGPGPTNAIVAYTRVQSNSLHFDFHL